MHYFIHIFTGSHLIADPEGAEFSTMAEVRSEAAQSARELIAEELRCGRPAPLAWEARIANDRGYVVEVILFRRLAGDAGRPSTVLAHGSASTRDTVGFAALFERSRATAERAHAITKEIQSSVGDIRNGIRALAALKFDKP